MIEHPLVPVIMEIDDKLNELIKVQKELHFAFLSGVNKLKKWIR